MRRASDGRGREARQGGKAGRRGREARQGREARRGRQARQGEGRIQAPGVPLARRCAVWRCCSYRHDEDGVEAGPARKESDEKVDAQRITLHRVAARRYSRRGCRGRCPSCSCSCSCSCCSCSRGRRRGLACGRRRPLPSAVCVVAGGRMQLPRGAHGEAAAAPAAAPAAGAQGQGGRADRASSTDGARRGRRRAGARAMSDEGDEEAGDGHDGEACIHYDVCPCPPHTQKRGGEGCGEDTMSDQRYTRQETKRLAASQSRPPGPRFVARC